MEITTTQKSISISREKVINYLENKRYNLYHNNYDSYKEINDRELILPDKETYDENDIKQIFKQNREIVPRENLGDSSDLQKKLLEKSYLITGTITDSDIKTKINKRILKSEEYHQLLEQLEKYGSILPTSNKRSWNYGGGGGDIILSLSTKKIYDVDDGDGLKTLLDDYQGKQYYTSRSGASGSGYMYAGKRSLVFLPSIRMDVAHPGSEGNFGNINGLEMAVLTYRGKVAEDRPTVIKDCAQVDVVLLDQSDHLSPNGSGKVLAEAINTKGTSLSELPKYTYTTEYYDENLEKQTLSFTYRTNIDPQNINISDIGKYFLNINRSFDVEQTGSFIDKTVGIRKYKDKYIRLGTFGLIKEVYDTYPISGETDKLYFEDIEIGSGNSIHHVKEEIPLSSDHPVEINGWSIKNNLATKKNKKNKVLSTHNIEDLCQYCNESIDTIGYIGQSPYGQTIYKGPTYALIYERKIAEIYPQFKDIPEMYMEYEEDIPEALLHKYGACYREEYMHNKLIGKLENEILNSNRWSEGQQKELIKKYLLDNLLKTFVPEDSYKAGNCKPGTAGFIKAYRLPEDKIAGKHILKHPRFESMLENSRFRAVILKKIMDDIAEAIS